MKIGADKNGSPIDFTFIVFNETLGARKKAKDESPMTLAGMEEVKSSLPPMILPLIKSSENELPINL